MAFDIALRDGGSGFDISLSGSTAGGGGMLGRRGLRPRNRAKSAAVTGGEVGNFIIDEFGNFIVTEIGDYLTWA